MKEMITLKCAMRNDKGYVIFGVSLKSNICCIQIVILDCILQLAFKDTQREIR